MYLRFNDKTVEFDGKSIPHVGDVHYVHEMARSITQMLAEHGTTKLGAELIMEEVSNIIEGRFADIPVPGSCIKGRFDV